MKRLCGLKQIRTNSKPLSQNHLFGGDRNIGISIDPNLKIQLYKEPKAAQLNRITKRARKKDDSNWRFCYRERWKNNNK